MVPTLSHFDQVQASTFHKPADINNLTDIEKLHLPKVTLPPVVEDGNQAPIIVQMEHPMEDDHYIKSIQILNFNDPVVIYPSSGTGAWVAALINCLSPGDKVLAFETGHFTELWKSIAIELGLDVVYEPGDWRSSVNPNRLDQVAANPLYDYVHRQQRSLLEKNTVVSLLIDNSASMRGRRILVSAISEEMIATVL